MAQRLLVDRRWRGVYLAAIVAGCGGGSAGGPAWSGPVVPQSAQPVSAEQVQAWVKMYQVDAARLMRFKFLFRDSRSSAGGKGTARLAAPDTVRIDVAGPLGAGAGGAMVVDDSVVWADPPDILKKFVPDYPLMWALFGVARPPAEGAELRGMSDARITAWQYIAGEDTVEYARVSGDTPRFLAESRRGGNVLGRADVILGADGTPVSARLTVPSGPARLDITFVASQTREPFGPETWTPRKP